MKHSNCVGMRTRIVDLAMTMDLSTTRYLLVLNESQRVIGVISQGDMIRAMPIQAPITAQDIMETDFYFVEKGFDRKQLATIMIQRNLIFVPVLTEDMKLISVVEIWDL